ncbi:YlbF family regulator [Paenibacillus camelliae]|uniref:YlbF family regulator n=1 Tax=Paenibacillus camelliae TaxID=512410 RepID=UPI00203DD484|nr:YlbF family regulator [Paenibacillus camelliae]MCM3632758.1 YlbF family regulator [Paenibacillus camelliae]
MIITLANQTLIDKVAELCKELLQQESYKSLRAMINQFVHDEEAVQQYKRFLQHQQELEQKEEREQLTAEELRSYEQEEMALYENPVIRQYLYAEQEFGKLHRLMSQFYNKTIEFDRLPELSELKKEGCGCGGACGGH